jgi:hypothetical protein
MTSSLDAVEIKSWEYFHVLEWAERSGFVEQATFDTIFSLKINGLFLMNELLASVDPPLRLGIHDPINKKRLLGEVYKLWGRHNKERNKTLEALKVESWSVWNVLEWAEFYGFGDKNTIDIIYKNKIDGKAMLSIDPLLTVEVLGILNPTGIWCFNSRIKDIRARHLKEIQETEMKDNDESEDEQSEDDEEEIVYHVIEK